MRINVPLTPGSRRWESPLPRISEACRIVYLRTGRSHSNQPLLHTGEADIYHPIVILRA